MTDVLAPTPRPSAPAPHVAPSVDEARAVAEAARETEWTAPSFVRELFEGRLRLGLIHPFPAPDPEDVAQGAAVPRSARDVPPRQVDSDRSTARGRSPPT